MRRREFIVGASQAGLLAATIPGRILSAQTSPYSALSPGAAVDRFKKAEQRLLSRYGVSAHSLFVRTKSAQLPMHVLEVGRGQPVLMLHGGGLSACSWAQLLAPLQQRFHGFAPDLP